jgi:hypothetical protein
LRVPHLWCEAFTKDAPLETQNRGHKAWGCVNIKIYSKNLRKPKVRSIKASLYLIIREGVGRGAPTKAENKK